MINAVKCKKCIIGMFYRYNFIYKNVYKKKSDLKPDFFEKYISYSSPRFLTTEPSSSRIPVFVISTSSRADES